MGRDDRSTPREILSANLQRLKKARPELGSPKKIAEASAGALSNGAVGRMSAASHATPVDSLGPLARVFGLEPWQLLVEGLDPENLPSLTTTPMLEQIRSLVSVPTHGISRTDEELNPLLASADSVTPGNSKSSRRRVAAGSGLQKDIVVGKGAKNERSTAGRVQKPRTRRNP